MLVKAYLGDGRWRLREVPRGRSLEWSTNLMFVPCNNENGDLDWDYFKDDRVPDARSGELIITPAGFVPRERFADSELRHHPDAESMRLFRWVRWDTGNGSHVLVTDGDVFICNDKGDTIEILR